MEEPWVDGCEVDDLSAAHTMSDTDEGGLHLISKSVDHEEQVERVVLPIDVVAELSGVERIAGALGGYVGDPDGVDGEGFWCSVDVVEEWFVHFLCVVRWDALKTNRICGPLGSRYHWLL